MKNKYSLILIFFLLQVVACKKEAKQPPVQPPLTELQVYGLGSHLTAEKSLNKDYNYYYDQFDGSAYQAINCGPTVTTMAIKWADPAFSKAPVDARNTIPASGGWWYTTDIGNYLTMDNINYSIVSFNASNSDNVIRHSIDNNNEVILCLDMSYALYNASATEHTNKFYATNSDGWGHFLLVKGYKEVDGKVYYEIYDPYTDHKTYQDNSPKGKDRYYLNTTITDATSIWWAYAMIIAPKGQHVVASSGMKINSIQSIPAAKGR
ncbi:MAG TPA: hypothetical protein VK668_00360 [Mucilaginibacter sp.]|nr:hypothetical protein [Mucilaginibacter sp.]